MTNPFAILQQMQGDSLATAPGLPEEVQAAELWSGVGFRVHDAHLLTPLESIVEILQYPTTVTPVPRTKPWLLGVANVRGVLLSIIDMARFFDKEPIFINDRARVLVINDENLRAGLLVNEVFGLRHFDEELERQTLTGVDDPLMSLCFGAFLRDNTLWGQFEMRRLAEIKSFLRAAA